MSYTLVAGLACLLILGVLTPIVSHLCSPLRSIPGPSAARFTKLWFLYRVRRGRFEQDNVNLHRKYGDIVRYAPGHYSFNSPEAVKLFYGKGTELDKSSWYEAWNAPGFKSLFTEPSIKAHGHLRRKFQSSYSMSSLVTYEAYVDHCIALLKMRLESIVDSGGRADMAAWFLCFAADSVAMITYSKRMGFLDRGEDIDDFFKDLHGNAFYSTTIGIYAGLHPFIFYGTAWLVRMGLLHGSARMAISRFTTARISEKRQERQSQEKQQPQSENTNGDAPKDFLSKFLDSHEQDPNRFTERDINVGLIGNVVAGADTTAAALSAVLYCLLKHPSTLSKLRAEISDRAKNGELSQPPTFKEAQSLPYLQAVIQEAQRLYPAAGLPLQRVVPGGGVDVNGYHFPAGTVVGVNSFVLHTNTKIFGNDADSFRPERWLDTDQEKVAYMQRHFMAFGLGSRTCIGKHISMLEMLKLVPVLVTTFDFELDNELKKDGVDWQWIAYWLMRPSSLPVTVRLRQN